ncbi:MAG: hybrid sensor histidine kinase/response regulator, partial [Candidatus Krumholzibacteria bacterium]|nr:hybrid sensor histidine kinase/response regulator [Candidatus Krumholzibacteria bacterium]
MPQMNGKQLYERVAARCPRARVLFMSGYTDEVISHRGFVDEGVNFIQKPFTVSDLAGKVREVLDG